MIVVSGRVVSADFRNGSDGQAVACGVVASAAGEVVCSIPGADSLPQVGRWAFFSVSRSLGYRDNRLYVFGEWLQKAPDLASLAADAILQGV